MSLRSLSNCFKCILVSLLLLEVSSCTTREPQQSTDSTRLSIHDTTAAKKYVSTWPPDTSTFYFCLPCDSMLKMSADNYEDLYSETGNSRGTTYTIYMSRAQYAWCLDTLNFKKARRLIPDRLADIDSLTRWFSRAYMDFLYVSPGTNRPISCAFFDNKTAYFIDSLIGILAKERYRVQQKNPKLERSINRYFDRAQRIFEPHFAWYDSVWRAERNTVYLEETLKGSKNIKQLTVNIRQLCTTLPIRAAHAVANWFDYTIRSANDWGVGVNRYEEAYISYVPKLKRHK